MNKIYSDIEKAVNEYYEKSVYFKYKKITENKDGSVSFSINNIKLYGVKVANQGLYFFIKNQLFDMLTDIPVTYSFADLPSLPEFRRIIIAENDFITLLVYITNNLDNYAREFILPTDYFDCCSRFEECSNTMKCINPYPDLAARCTYRRKLENGIVFYGDNCHSDNSDSITDNLFDSLNISMFYQAPERPKRNKGKSMIDFPKDYVVFDLETTGLDPFFDSIIEVGILRIRENEIVNVYSSLVNPGEEIDEYITQLTGITNEMLSQAPDISQIINEIYHFIGNDIIIGHNVNFDINFMYDCFVELLNKPLENDFIDTMRLSRKILPELEHHRLTDIADYYNVSVQGSHRSISDCKKTYYCFCEMKKHVTDNIGLSAFQKSFKRRTRDKLDLRKITSDNFDFDETHILYGKRCVFTGTLEKMTRSEAAQLVVNYGGICENGITKKTNYLILGNNDYCKSIKDGKSNKQKKAEEYKLNGIDIEIIPENVFYDMIDMNE